MHRKIENTGAAETGVVRRTRLVIEMDVEVYDPAWDDNTLIENAVCWLEAAIEHQRERDRRYSALHPEEGNPYDAPESEMQVWANRSDYLADVTPSEFDGPLG